MGKSKDKKLEVHHIIFKSNGGSDEPEILITLCKTCHDNLHDGNIKLIGGKIKGYLSRVRLLKSISIVNAKMVLISNTLKGARYTQTI